MEDKGRAYNQRLLSQYIEGTISQEDRFALEKRALDDPFLFEALEGLQPKDSKNKEAIGKLKSNIESTTKLNKESKRIPLFNYGIAASLILLLGVSMWFFSSNIDKSESVVMNTPVQDMNTKIQKSSEEEEITIDLDERYSESRSLADVAEVKSEKTNNQYDSPKAIISQVESERDFNSSDGTGINNSPPSTTIVDNRNQAIANEDLARLAIGDNQKKENKKTTVYQKSKPTARQGTLKDEAGVINKSQIPEEVTPELSESIEMANDAVKEVGSTLDKAKVFQNELVLDKSEYINAIGTNILAAPEEGLTDFREGIKSTSQKLRNKKASGSTHNILIQFHINEEGETSDFEIISGDDPDCINRIISKLKYSSKWITNPANSAVNVQLDLSCN